MSKLLGKLQQELEEHKKVLQETPEHEHTDVLLQRRMGNLHVFITTHYPDNSKRRRMLALVHEMQKLSHEALEQKA